MSEVPPTEVDCCVAGGGPAGMVLGLLLARCGVRALVLEKHTDFLRDFRGDTVHPSTLRLLDELGLADAFLALPHQQVPRIAMVADDGTYRVADFTRLGGRFPFLAFVPQWDFLDFLADEGRREPAFELRMGAEVRELLRDEDGAGGGAVRGVRYRDRAGLDHEVRASLVVAADGRTSVLRELAGLRVRDFGAPMDVLWFRLPKAPGAVGPGYGGAGRVAAGRLVVLLDRGDYWQTAYVVPKGRDAAVRAAGLEALRADLVRLVPGLEPAVAHLRSWDDVRVLSVRVDRLRRWHRPGLLLVGDAAHAMSPIGGVGINLAVQDAAAAARLLAGPLRRGTPTDRELARVRRRRWLPTAATQLVQRVVQRGVLAPLLRTDQPVRAPALLRLLDRVPVLQGLPARAIGLGVLPEHAPACARRPTAR